MNQRPIVRNIMRAPSGHATLEDNDDGTHTATVVGYKEGKSTGIILASFSAPSVASVKAWRETTGRSLLKDWKKS